MEIFEESSRVIYILDIKSGRFAKDWILENQAGQPYFRAMKKQMRVLELEEVGKNLRKMMPWLEEKNVLELENEK